MSQPLLAAGGRKDWDSVRGGASGHGVRTLGAGIGALSRGRFSATHHRSPEVVAHGAAQRHLGAEGAFLTQRASVTDTTRGEITRLARRWSEGDNEAFDRLVELVYDDLRRIAHHHLDAGARGGTVNTTALVHEAYLKLARVEGGVWDGRAQFLAFCSKAMRRILIDYARRRSAAKRGGERVRVPLRDDAAVVEAEVTRMLAVEQALQRLESHDQRMGRIVECRFFGGMSVADTAEALGTSPRTVEREWARARVYLHEALGDAAEA